MPTDFTINNHHILQFTQNVELLLQQIRPRFAGAVAEGKYLSTPQGAMAQVIKQFGEVDFSPLLPGDQPNQWYGATVWDEIEHHQRWAIPADHKLSLPIAKQDELRMLGSPKSPYAEAGRAAYARLWDDYVIAAATNPAKTGTYDDLQDTVLPAEQIIGHDYDPHGQGQGLTISKLIKAKELLIAAGNEPSEPRFFACSERQLSDLLNTTEVTSADYNTLRALVRGELDTFLGFKFISTERLSMTAGTPPIRHCIAWVKSGIAVGMWDGLEVKVDERPDMNYVWQIYMRCTLGATRTQEKKVVQVNCSEADTTVTP